MDDATRAAQLTTISRMGVLVQAIQELIARSPDPASVRESIRARIEPVARVFEADDNPDRLLMAMEMRGQLDDLME